MRQADKQKKLAENLKNSNYVPGAVREATDIARRAANTPTAPGYGQAVDRARTATANAISRAERSSNNPNVVQQAVANADAAEREDMKDLDVQNQLYRERGRDRLTEALGAMGNYQQASRDAYNSAKSALKGAEMTNRYNAITTLGENLAYSMDGSAKITPSIEGKSGMQLTRGLARAQRNGRTLSTTEQEYIKKLGLNPNTLGLAFPDLKFNN